MRRSSRWTVGVVFLAARSVPAQAIGKGFELERSGQYEQAAAIYLATLRAEPTNISALLGLERVLPPLNRLGELLPVAQRAAAAKPSNVALRGVLLRTYVALNEPDSARALALEWARAAPRDEAPYREWAMALEDAHRRAAAGPCSSRASPRRLRMRRWPRGASPTSRAAATRPRRAACARSRSRATPICHPPEARRPGRAPTRRALSSRRAIRLPRVPCSSEWRRTPMRRPTRSGFPNARLSKP